MGGEPRPGGGRVEVQSGRRPWTRPASCAALSEGEAPLRILYPFAADAFDEVVYEFADEG